MSGSKSSQGPIAIGDRLLINIHVDDVDVDDVDVHVRPASPCPVMRRSLSDYRPFTIEQWVEAVFHVPESFTQVSLHITVRARCVPLSSAS